MARHAARERQPAGPSSRALRASIECSIFAASGGRGTELPLEGAKKLERQTPLAQRNAETTVDLGVSPYSV
jgi:hypothetical protein